MITELNNKTQELTKKDFVSDQAVRWCPGCGDYMILAMMQKTFAQMGHKKENFLSVSGIGCSSRITYYLDTFGIHSIHGRAIAVATGAKLANPELNVWVFTGDGDCMAIGGNHFIHACRRNVDMNIIVFNNKIYGMTKGQSSPTTPVGTKTKTSPEGSYEQPFNIGEVAIGSGATFFARVPDNDPRLLEEVMMEAYRHKGTSVIEVLQNCVIFTDGIHDAITGRETKDDNQLRLKHGEPLIFGKVLDKGISLNSMKLVKTDADGGKNNILIHDESEMEPQLHIALANLQLPDQPVAMGILRRVQLPCYGNIVHEAIKSEQLKSEYKNLDDLYRSGNTWDIS